MNPHTGESPHPCALGDAPGATVREALELYYRRAGLPSDGGAAAPSWAPLGVPWFKLPNFGWRRRALPVHDLHHLLVGYPCTPAGEFQMAAWEFAAGRFRNGFATGFCLPLVCLGALTLPRRTFAAFIRGRASRTLYPGGLTPAVLDSSLDVLRQAVLPAAAPRAAPRDVLLYGALVATSLAWSLSALVLVALLIGIKPW